MKHAAEIKLLIGCTNEDVQTNRNFNNELLILFSPNSFIDT